MGGEAVACGTHGTIGSKSALQTAARGLEHVTDDEANFLSGLIPIDRGTPWTLEQCYHGDDDHDAITEFKNKINEYPQLLETALLIEGIKINRSQHASGVFITNDKFTNYAPKMKTKKGLIVSQYDLHDAEKAGLLKYDFLTTKACDKIRTTLDLLVEYNHVEWQGNLRDTYNSVLHPHIMDYNKPEIWKVAGEANMPDLFQFKTPTGRKTIKLIQPKNVVEVAQANSLMRLQKPDHANESLTERFIRYRDDIQLWYDEMDSFNVPKRDQEILKQILGGFNGIAESQESIMILSQHKELANFTVGESHGLRKAVAKKSEKKYLEIMELFYKKAKENNVDENTLNYIWHEQIAMSRGYSFSVLHCLVYSMIAIQELFLYTQYPSIYWNTSCLLVNSGSLETEYDDKKRSSDYGKIAVAMANIKQEGIDIAPPKINEVEFGFIPDEKNNQIVFGLKALVGIGDDDAHNIVDNQPYESLNDAYERLNQTTREVELSTGKTQNQSLVPTSSFATLIKAGAFDELEDRDREEIMDDFIRKIEPPKDSLTMQNFDQLVEMNIIPEKYSLHVRKINFRNFAKDKNKIYKPTQYKSKKWYKITDVENNDFNYINDFFQEYYALDMKEDEDYYYNEKGDLIVMIGGASGFSKAYDKVVEEFRVWLESEDCVNRYNDIRFLETKEDLCGFDIRKWEMDSMNVYLNGHELNDVDLSTYQCTPLSEVPDINDYTKEELDCFDKNMYKGREYTQYPKYRIAGTVIRKMKNKHMLALLTTDGVINVKFSGGQYNYYNKRISKPNGDGTKTIISNSWFTRGNKVMIAGYKDGDQFRASAYNSNFLHSVVKIDSINRDNTLEIKVERPKV